jgi:hypothetical protein
MIFPNDTALKLMEWIATRLGLDLDLLDEGIVGSLDEEEVVEQLQHGRD